jgi:hypothetical protein
MCPYVTTVCLLAHVNVYASEYVSVYLLVYVSVSVYVSECLSVSVSLRSACECSAYVSDSEFAPAPVSEGVCESARQ